MTRIISGIQQVGVGVRDAGAAFQWYRDHFGFRTIVFEDKASATLMSRYTGDVVQDRYAILAMNLLGGGGLEIWQYTSREPLPPAAPLQLGDTGVFVVKLRCQDVPATHQRLREKGVHELSTISRNPLGRQHFYVTDPYGNHFEVLEDSYCFRRSARPGCGGVSGVVIGVSDMAHALSFYQKVLGYKQLSYYGERCFDDLRFLPGGDQPVKRAVLSSPPERWGAFSRLLGPSTVELVEAPDPRRRIYEQRYWGDLGFIHVCYDVTGMREQGAHCATLGYPFTVDSGNSFQMGKAAGQFAYNEDPDGTLIEYVETHRLPILKKLNWYLDLRRRPAKRPLPDWMLRCMGLGQQKLHLAS